MALVREYAASQSERAFEQLVARHLNLVHSAALRRVSDTQLAEEVARTRLCILARKAGFTRPASDFSPAGFTAPRAYAAADALKIQPHGRQRGKHRRRASAIAGERTAIRRNLATDRTAAGRRNGFVGQRDRNAVVLRRTHDSSGNWRRILSRGPIFHQEHGDRGPLRPMISDHHKYPERARENFLGDLIGLKCEHADE